MILIKLFLSICMLSLSIGTALSQNSDSQPAPAGNWLASCDGPKLKIDDGYEICLITIDTSMYDSGYFSSEFYFGVDYTANGKQAEFDCASGIQTWEYWGINLYFSFSYDGSYSRSELTFNAGDGYSMQNSYQLKPEFINITATYKLIDANQLKLIIEDKEYLFYRMNKEY